MTLNRRKFLTLIGGGTIFAATAGVSAFLATRTPDKALAPWLEAGNYTDPRKRALSYAILAPNPHNRQPWLADLSQQDEITLYADLERLLPHTDPYNRQITIGLGCFLELLRMAAAEDGYRAEITPFPEGADMKRLDKRPVARVSFFADETIQKDPLFAHVLERRSLKEPFDTARPVTEQTLQNLQGVVQGEGSVSTTNDHQMLMRLRRLTREAMAIEIRTPHTYKESVDLFRIGKAEINANPDGIDFSGPLFDSLSALGLFSRELALDTESTFYQQSIDAIMTTIETAMGYIWLTTPSNTRDDQLKAGRDWIRINLAATAEGVGLHPLSQALQEYPEMSGEFAEVHRLLAEPGETIQMLGRLGYADAIAPSPRWPVSEKIIGT